MKTRSRNKTLRYRSKRHTKRHTKRPSNRYYKRRPKTKRRLRNKTKKYMRGGSAQGLVEDITDDVNLEYKRERARHDIVKRLYEAVTFKDFCSKDRMWLVNDEFPGGVALDPTNKQVISEFQELKISHIPHGKIGHILCHGGLLETYTVVPEGMSFYHVVGGGDNLISVRDKHTNIDYITYYPEGSLVQNYSLRFDPSYFDSTNTRTRSTNPNNVVRRGLRDISDFDLLFNGVNHSFDEVMDGFTKNLGEFRANVAFNMARCELIKALSGSPIEDYGNKVFGSYTNSKSFARREFPSHMDSIIHRDLLIPDIYTEPPVGHEYQTLHSIFQRISIQKQKETEDNPIPSHWIGKFCRSGIEGGDGSSINVDRLRKCTLDGHGDLPENLFDENVTYEGVDSGLMRQNSLAAKPILHRFSEIAHELDAEAGLGQDSSASLPGNSSTRWSTADTIEKLKAIIEKIPPPDKSIPADKVAPTMKDALTHEEVCLVYHLHLSR